MPTFPHITDPEFADAAGRIEIHRHYEPRETRSTKVDRLGYGRWLTDYLTARARGLGHESAIRAVERALDAATDGPPPPPPVDPVEPGSAPLIEVHHRVFLNTYDDRVHDGREASCFMLLARLLRGEDIRPIISGWRDRRMNWLRVLGMVGTDFWQSRGWRLFPSDAGYDATLDLLCRVTRDRGMGLRFTLFADAQVCCPSRAERGLFAQRVGRVLSRHHHVVAEMANEPSLNGFAEGDPRELADLARILKAEAPHVHVALGAEHGARGHLKTYDAAPADYVTFHAERMTNESGWAWVRRLSEYGVVLDGERPVWSGEPINAGSEGAHRDFQTDPAIWFAYGALSRIVPAYGYVPCLHLHRGLWAELPGDEATEACVRAFHAGCDAVPIDAKFGVWVNGHWAESPFRGFSQTDPPSDNRPSRIFGRLVDGRYIGVAIRAPRDWSHGDLRFPVRKVAEQAGERFDCQVWRGLA